MSVSNELKQVTDNHSNPRSHDAGGERWWPGGGTTAPNLREFGNSGSGLGSVYVIFGFYRSCFDEFGDFVKEKKEGKGRQRERVSPGSIRNRLKGYF